MNEAASLLLNHSTFTSFSKSGSDQKTDRCKITIAEWRPYQDGIWKFHISADRFLRGMVRAIVGTLLDVGYGKTIIENFNEIIESKDRTKAGASVAAHALFLCDIQYPTHKLTAPSCVKPYIRGRGHISPARSIRLHTELLYNLQRAA